jgi:hypothetical protein
MSKRNALILSSVLFVAIVGITIVYHKLNRAVVSKEETFIPHPPSVHSTAPQEENLMTFSQGIENLHKTLGNPSEETIENVVNDYDPHNKSIKNRILKFKGAEFIIQTDSGREVPWTHLVRFKIFGENIPLPLGLKIGSSKTQVQGLLGVGQEFGSSIVYSNFFKFFFQDGVLKEVKQADEGESEVVAPKE